VQSSGRQSTGQSTVRKTGSVRVRVMVRVRLGLNFSPSRQFLLTVAQVVSHPSGDVDSRQCYTVLFLQLSVVVFLLPYLYTI